VLGAPPRGGNHLLRGLLDGHPQLLLPPDEDYCLRHLARHPLQQLRGLLLSRRAAPAFYRRLQKDGHLERVNTGRGKEVFGAENSLDLNAYYAFIRQHHKRLSLDNLVRNHLEALAVSLGHRPGDGRLRVYFSSLQPSNLDLSKVSALLSRSYSVRGIFLVRDPRAHLASKLVRNPSLNLARFCRRQNRYLQEIDDFAKRYGPVLKMRFEDLVVDTPRAMARVCEFAGIEFSARMLEYTQGGQPSQSNSSFSATAGVDQEVLYRYRKTLPQDTIAFLQAHCSQELFWREPGQDPANDPGDHRA